MRRPGRRRRPGPVATGAAVSPVAPPPGAHGGDGARLAAALGRPVDDVLDLSMSLNPCAPPVASVVAEVADEVARYPDPTAATAVLAEAMGVDPGRLLLTNGGAEAIALVAQALPTGRVEDPEFSLYARHLAHLDPEGPRWRSNPHNPTGRLAGADERAAVWDEAFYPLAAGAWTRGDPGALVVGSLTKLWACPGLRLGYVLAPDPALVDQLAGRQPAWSVNGLALAALPTLLARTDLVAWRDRIADLREDLVTLLADHGLEAEASDAPYLLVPEAAGVREHLAGHGIAVRDTASFGLVDGIRVAVPDDAGRRRLAAALEAR